MFTDLPPCHCSQPPRPLLASFDQLVPAAIRPLVCHPHAQERHHHVFYQLIGQAFRWSKRWQLSRPMPWPPGTPLLSVEMERRKDLGVVCRAGSQARAGRPALFFQYTPHEGSWHAAARMRGGVGAVATCRLQVGPTAAGCGRLTPHYS